MARNALSVLVAISLLCACARLEPIRAGEPVSIVAVPARYGRAMIDISGRDAEKATRAGWIGGTAAAHAGALACGMAAPICLLPGLLVLGTAGALAGGAAADVIDGLPAETHAQIRDRMQSF